VCLVLATFVAILPPRILLSRGSRPTQELLPSRHGQRTPFFVFLCRILVIVLSAWRRDDSRLGLMHNPIALRPGSVVGRLLWAYFADHRSVETYDLVRPGASFAANHTALFDKWCSLAHTT